MSLVNERTWAEINLNAIEHNYNLAKKLSGNKEIMPVIKANAYGHGAVEIAKFLSELGAKYFAVATADEAVQLRTNGIDDQILILGASHASCFHSVLEHSLIQTVPSLEYACCLNEYAISQNKRAKVHIKADTGMGRIGFDARSEKSVETAVKEILQMRNMKGLEIEGLFTHFATADIPKDSFALHQHRMFSLLEEAIKNEGMDIPCKHISNSGDIVNYSDNEHSLVREGIILYGYMPDKQSLNRNFIPAMSVKTRVSHVSFIKEGESIGYGRSYVAPCNMKVAVIPIGYADGYPRALSNRGKVLINNNLCPVVGRVCMDQTMVDITGLEVNVGDTVTVMGPLPAMSVEDIADEVGTISYEVLCNVSSRVKRVYIKQ